MNPWRKLVEDHNAECERSCDPDRCKYRPYFDANGRRCSECPVYNMIEVPNELQVVDADPPEVKT